MITNQKNPRQRRRTWLKALFITGLLLLIVIVGSVFAVRRMYTENLKPVGTSQRDQEVTIPAGATPQDIASILKEAGLIKETWAFEWYIRNENLREYLKAGTYELRQSMSVPQIANILTEGRVATDLVTILPGKRLDQIRESLITNYRFDATEVDAALNARLYTDHPALVDKPRDANLEGYLYPESFLRNAETDPQTIVRASLDEMQKNLTPELRKAIVSQGLTVHEGVILASIIEREVSVPDDRRKVAQVFLKRLREGMKLESDATASYGAILDNAEPSLSYNSRYNTYIYEGLTPTPISNVSATSLNAVADPSDTDYLYFVSGDDGTTHFSFTLEEHETKVERYCTELCQ